MFCTFCLQSSRYTIPIPIKFRPDRKSFLLLYKQNINHLFLEFVHNYLENNTLPSLAKAIEKEQNVGMYMSENLMADNGLKTLALTIVQRWLQKLGFKYKTRTKTY